ncbi:MAG: hypothetical protein V7L23_11685 [Nostoc sp.]
MNVQCFVEKNAKEESTLFNYKFTDNWSYMEKLSKHQFTQSAIAEDLFRNFLYIGSLDYEEDSKLQSSGSPIAAKRAYLMRKKNS